VKDVILVPQMTFPGISCYFLCEGPHTVFKFFSQTPLSYVSYLRTTYQVSHWTCNIIMYKLVHLNLKLFDELCFKPHFSSLDVYIMNCYINYSFFFLSE